MENISINPVELATNILTKYIKDYFSINHSLSKVLIEYVAFKIISDFNEKTPTTYSEVVKYTDSVIQNSLLLIQSEISPKSRYPFPAPFIKQNTNYPPSMYATLNTKDSSVLLKNRRETD